MAIKDPDALKNDPQHRKEISEKWAAKRTRDEFAMFTAFWASLIVGGVLFLGLLVTWAMHYGYL